MPREREQMIDAEYFKTHLRAQVEELGEATVELRLYDGRVFMVKEIDSVQAGYVLLQVYPSEGVTEESKQVRRKPGDDTDKVYFDRLALPYESIVHVFLTVKKSESQPGIGFVG